MSDEHWQKRIESKIDRMSDSIGGLERNTAVMASEFKHHADQDEKQFVGLNARMGVTEQTITSARGWVAGAVFVGSGLGFLLWQAIALAMQ